MLRRLEKMVGFKVEGTDGEVGKANGFYFDDQEWMIRYFVVETGPWLASKLVLISPACAGAPDWQSARLPVELTKKQVADSPDIDLHKPVSQQQFEALHDYYGWPSYWGEGPAWEMGYWVPLPIAPEKKEEKSTSEAQAGQTEKPKDDPHLRSVSEVTGYHIQATDGDIGHVVDFFADEATWRIEYLLVDTRNLLPGRHVIISPRWISEVNWEEGKVHVNVTREKVKNSPRFDTLPDIFTRDEEIGLHDHFESSYPPYWGPTLPSDRRSR